MKKQSGLSKNELKTLAEIESVQTGENISAIRIAGALNKSLIQTYRIIKKLKEKGFLEEDRKIILQKHSFIPILLDILKKHPQIIPVLADSGINILKELSEPLKIEEVEAKTGLKKVTIHKKLKSARKFSIIKKDGKKYVLTKKLWPELSEFLEDYKRYLLRIDNNVDAALLIRAKYPGGLIVESNKELENATPTAFSVYYKYGIKILNPFDYYHIPKKKLSIKDVFRDSLLILKDDKEYRKTLYAILFYIRNKSKLGKVEKEFVYKVKALLNGENIEGYPDLKEIKEKAELYDIHKF